MTTKPITIEELRGMYGAPGSRNTPDVEGIREGLVPYSEGKGGINIGPGGQIIPPSDVKAIQDLDPDAAERLHQLQDLNRSF